MSNGLKIGLITVGGIVGIAGLLLAGIAIGREIAYSDTVWWEGSVPARSTWAQRFADLRQGPQAFAPRPQEFPYSDPRFGGFGMMGSNLGGYGMMGSGMMGSNLGGYGMMGSGMMGPYLQVPYGRGTLLGIEPIEISEARSAVEAYLETLNDPNLELGEIMIFDNHAYIQVVEVDSGIGALELLVDPVTLAVTPEHGPSMMWNQKYSPMAGMGALGMMGGMSFESESSMMDMMEEDSGFTQSQIGSEGATDAAQRYLDIYLPGSEAGEPPDGFYGYYTLHIEREGDVVGMLSVNSITGQVWPHTWHGELLEIADHE